MARKTSRKYVFRSTLGFNADGVDPQAVGESIAELSEREAVTPRNIVDEAKDDVSPLHPAFEWDDTVAADEHRLGQARSLVRAVYVIPEPEQPPQPVYYRIVEDKEARYEKAEAVFKNVDLIECARETLLRELKSAERSLNEFEDQAKRAGSKKAARQAARVRKSLDLALSAATD